MNDPSEPTYMVNKLEIAKHARQNCRTCGGQGWYGITKTMFDQTRKLQTTKEPKLCRCAMKRFLARLKKDQKYRDSLPVKEPT
jgi:hypothetical protein